MQLEKVYEPQRFEPHWAQWWIDQGIFHADAQNPAPVFSLVIPPPNVTGSLHIGHMLEHAEIDCTIRWHRMRGDNTLWLPGTDHAGISTEMMVVRQLAQEGTSRNEIGREPACVSLRGNDENFSRPRVEIDSAVAGHQCLRSVNSLPSARGEILVCGIGLKANLAISMRV